MTDMELGNMAFGHSRGEVPLDRNEYQDEFWRLTRAMDPDNYSGVHFENDIFEMHPYCWCDGDDCPQCGSMEQPNFEYKPTGYRIRWYKWPLRDSYANVHIDIEEFTKMVDHCIESLNES